MATKQKQVVQAVQAALTPAEKKAADKLAAVRGDRLAEFVAAYLLARVDAKAAEASGVTAFDRYAEAFAAGITPKQISSHCMDAAEQEADAQADVATERDRASSTCAQYKRRVEALVAAGVALVDAAGNIMPTGTATVAGVKVTAKLCSLGAQLVAAQAKARGTKGNGKRAGSGEGEGEGEGAGEVSAPVAQAPSLKAQAQAVAEAMAATVKVSGDGMSGDGVALASILMDVCPDVITAMAQAIHKARLATTLQQAARKVEGERKARSQKARLAAEAEELAEDVLADAMLADFAALANLPIESLGQARGIEA